MGDMYLPAHFTMTEQCEIEGLLANIGAADLVTRTTEGLTGSFLPFLYVANANANVGRATAANANVNAASAANSNTDAAPPSFEGNSLHGHLSRANTQWKSTIDPEALVIAHTVDGYISPNGYPSKLENAETVPTWNYITLNIHGKLIVHDDPTWTLDLVRRLTDHHEKKHASLRNETPWSVDDAPDHYIDTMLKGIVGIEIVIECIEAKAKLSQNKSDSDALGAAADLDQGTLGEVELARTMRAAR